MIFYQHSTFNYSGLAMVVSAIVISFFYQWRLALFMLGTIPPTCIIMSLMAKVNFSNSQQAATKWWHDGMNDMSFLQYETRVSAEERFKLIEIVPSNFKKCVTSVPSDYRFTPKYAYKFYRKQLQRQ